MSYSFSVDPSEPLFVLLVAACIDLALGDPQFRLHPIRLLGDLSRIIEWMLRRIRLSGYLGGIVHLLIVCSVPVLVWWGLRSGLSLWGAWPVFIFDVVVAWQFLCFRDLLDHGRRVLRAESLEDAQQSVGMLVGRDTHTMSRGDTVRSTIESLSENLTDGVLTPVWAFCLGGLPALIVVKAISTLDSMVGYKNERYQRFGWASARCDDLIHYIPARISMILIAISAALVGGYPKSAVRSAWDYHAMLESPNSGWSEAAIAGALRLRLLGPIYLKGVLVNDTWMGPDTWHTEADAQTLRKALWIIFLSGMIAWFIGIIGHMALTSVDIELWPFISKTHAAGVGH